MSATFASQEWADSLAVHLNDSARVRTNSVTWVFGPVLVVVDADEAHGFGGAAIELDIHEGSISSVRVGAVSDAVRTPWAFGGTLARWRTVFAGELDLIDAVTQAKMRMRGDLPTLERHRGLFQAIAASGAAIETTWQDEPQVAAPA